MPLKIELDVGSACVQESSHSPEDLLMDASRRLVADFNNYPPFYDEPRLFHIVATIPSSQEIDEADFGELKEDDPESVVLVGGCSLDRTRAMWKALGEAIEREALTFREGLPIKYGSYETLDSQALNPNTLPAGTSRLSKDRRRMEMGWVRGISLPTFESTFVPAQLVYVPYLYRHGEAVLRAPMSTGAAAGSSTESALAAGLAEVVERDAFMSAWLTQLPLHRIQPSDLPTAAVSKLFHTSVEKCFRYKLKPEFLILPTDIPLSVILCVLWDDTGVGPCVSVGAKAASNITLAALGALEEAQQLRPWLRSLLNEDPQLRTSPHTLHPTHLAERAKLWLSHKAEQKLRGWLALASPAPSTGRSDHHDSTLREIISALQVAGASVFAVDLTANHVAELGFTALRVVVPEFQPLYLDDDLPDVAWPRLERLRTSGEHASRLSEESIEVFPHPFL